MTRRFDISKVEPKAYEAMLGLEKYLKQTSLRPLHLKMIKIRASQINECPFCIRMHTQDARKLGETEQRIYALSAWRDSPLFDEEERAILALTEEITLVAQTRVRDEVYNEAARLFDPNYLAQLVMAIVTINAWNRIAVTSRLAFEPAQSTVDDLAEN
jgi:AhpD family alkylhydroperoxidase